MQELREALAKLKFKNISTYIQSGNVVFQSSEKNTTILQEKIQHVILKQFKFEVPVLVKKPFQIQNLLSAYPFLEVIKPNSFKHPQTTQIKELETLSCPNETFRLVEDYIYLYNSQGYGRAKCNTNFF